jgi:hypothetical protein
MADMHFRFADPRNADQGCSMPHHCISSKERQFAENGVFGNCPVCDDRVPIFPVSRLCGSYTSDNEEQAASDPLLSGDLSNLGQEHCGVAASFRRRLVGRSSLRSNPDPGEALRQHVL